MVTVDLGWLRTANGLVMLLNLAAAIVAIVFWEMQFSKTSKQKLKNRTDGDIYYTCACAIALVIVAIVFFLTLCGKLTKRVLALVFLGIAAVLVIIAVIVAIQQTWDYRQVSLMAAAVLGGGLVANLVYTGVGGIRVST